MAGEFHATLMNWHECFLHHVINSCRAASQFYSLISYCFKHGTALHILLIIKCCKRISSHMPFEIAYNFIRLPHRQGEV